MLFGAATGTCDELATCVITCDAKKGAWPGLTGDCAQKCKDDVGAETGTGSIPASPAAFYVYDNLATCAMSQCSGAADYKAFLGCLGNACQDLAQVCFPKG